MIWVPVLTCVAFHCFGSRVEGPPLPTPEACINISLAVQKRLKWDPVWIDCQPHEYFFIGDK